MYLLTQILLLQIKHQLSRPLALFIGFCSLGVFSGMAEAQVTPSDVNTADNADLAQRVGGETESLGLQRPVELSEFPFNTTFLLNSRMVRTSNFLKVDSGAEKSLVYELGGTVSLGFSEVTLFDYPVNPSLNLTHLRFFNRKLADILDFETQVAAFGLAVPITDTITITPGLDYSRLISPGGNEHKFHGTGTSLTAMKIIPHGDSGMFMIIGGGKLNWTKGDALIDTATGAPIFSVDPITGNVTPVRTQGEQDRWDVNLNLAYMYSYENGIVISPSVGVLSSNFTENRNDGRHDFTYTAGLNISKTFFDALNVGIFGAFSMRDTNDIGEAVNTQDFENFDYGISIGYSKSF
jgi:hypothetical protein